MAVSAILDRPVKPGDDDCRSKNRAGRTGESPLWSPRRLSMVRGTMTLPASALPIEQPPAFLGVTRSLTGKFWRDRLDARGAARALAIAQRHQLPEMLARVLAGRD